MRFVEAGSLSVPGCCQAALIAEFPGCECKFFVGGRVLEGDAQCMQVQSTLHTADRVR